MVLMPTYFRAPPVNAPAITEAVCRMAGFWSAMIFFRPFS